MEATETRQQESGTAKLPPQKMKAMVQGEYGATDVLKLDEVALPAPEANEVLIQVHAAGVDRGVWHLMTGLPYLVRLAGYGLLRPKNPVLGMDVSGRVLSIGSKVTRFEVGDEVFGIANGSFAEYTTANEDKLAKKPAALTFEQAAASAVSGITALEGLIDVGQLKANQRVLIIGASGGVGTFSVQIAKALGAHVTGVCGPGGEDMLRSLGADEVIDYSSADFTEGGNRYDLVFDLGGRNSISRLRSVLSPRGTLVIVGGEGGNSITGGVGRQLRAMMLSPLIKQRLTTFISSEHYTNIERLAQLLESGAVVPSIGQRFGLAEVPAAIQRLESSGSNGKIVIVVREE